MRESLDQFNIAEAKGLATGHSEWKCVKEGVTRQEGAVHLKVNSHQVRVPPSFH